MHMGMRNGEKVNAVYCSSPPSTFTPTLCYKGGLRGVEVERSAAFSGQYAAKAGHGATCTMTERAARCCSILGAYAGDRRPEAKASGYPGTRWVQARLRGLLNSPLRGLRPSSPPLQRPGAPTA